MKKYRDLLFDVDNTLLNFDLAEHDAMIDALNAFSFPATEEVITTYSDINDRYWKMLERGEITREKLLSRRFDELGRTYGWERMDGALFDRTYRAALAKKSYLMDGALETCRALAGKYRLSAITNGNTSVQQGRFFPSPLAPLFSHCFISEEMGCAKPSEAYFALVRAALPDLEPSETLVVGDSLSSDIAGGVRWGTDTCRFCPHGIAHAQVAPSDLSPTYTIEHLGELLDILL